MNVIIPIAGASKLVGNTEYISSLQEIERKTILQRVFESLQGVKTEHFVVVIKREDAHKFHLDNIVKLLRPEAEIVIAEGSTAGAACTCLLAIDMINMEEPLLITGGDQVITVSPQSILEYFVQSGFDGGVAIFEDIHPRWSYVRLDEKGYVVEAAEKRPISRNATAGFYYFRKAGYFVEAAKKMILKNANVNGSYYICPVFNEMILKQQLIGCYKIDKSSYYSLSHDSGVETYKLYLQSIKEKNES